LLLLSRNIVAVSLFDAFKTLVFLSAFLDKTAGDKVLKLFVSAEPKHFFAPAYSVALPKPVVNQFKEIIEAEELVLIAKDVHQFVSDVIREPT